MIVGKLSDYKEPGGGDGVAVIQVEWTEYERGWGQRPNGYSYHLDKGAAKLYIDEFLAGMPPQAPECYSAPGTPTMVWVDPVFALMVQGKEIVWSEKSQSR